MSTNHPPCLDEKAPPLFALLRRGGRFVIKMLCAFLHSGRDFYAERPKRVFDYLGDDLAEQEPVGFLFRVFLA